MPVERSLRGPVEDETLSERSKTHLYHSNGYEATTRERVSCEMYEKRVRFSARNVLGRTIRGIHCDARP